MEGLTNECSSSMLKGGKARTSVHVQVYEWLWCRKVNTSLFSLMDELRLSAGNWVELRWRGLRGRGVRMWSGAWGKEYTREYPQAELPECPFAICPNEFEIRQVIIFGCVSSSKCQI